MARKTAAQKRAEAQVRVWGLIALQRKAKATGADDSRALFIELQAQLKAAGMLPGNGYRDMRYGSMVDYWAMAGYNPQRFSDLVLV